MITLWTDGSVLAGEASQYAVWALALGRTGQAKRTLVGWNHRDGHGSPQALALPRLEGWVHPHRAELIAVIQGLYQARLAGHRQVLIRTDAQTLVRALNADGISALTPRQELDLPLWALYYGFRGGFEWVRVRWVARSRLGPIHYLAYEYMRALQKEVTSPVGLVR
jgi:ribonuclease HI